MISELLSNALAEEASATRLEDRLVREVPEASRADVRRLAEVLERYLNGVPVALDALTGMAKEPTYGRSVAFVAGQVLLYFVDEDDLFRESELGPLGLIDDAYLIHGSLATLRAAFPELRAPSGYEPPGGSDLAAVRSLLPAGVPDALDRTCENLVRVAGALYSGGGQDSSAPESPRPALRIDEALAALGA